MPRKKRRSRQKSKSKTKKKKKIQQEQKKEQKTVEEKTKKKKEDEEIQIKLFKDIELRDLRGYLLRLNLPSENMLYLRIPEEWQGTQIGTLLAQLFKGYFFHKLKTIRAHVYEDLNGLAVNLGGIWFIPQHRLIDFHLIRSKWKQEYEDYIRMLREFLNGKIPEELIERYRLGYIKLNWDYFELLEKYLRRRRIQVKLRELIEEKIQKIIKNFELRFTLFPVAFTAQYIRKSLEEEVQKKLEKVEEEEKEKIQIYYENLRFEMEQEMRTRIYMNAKKILESYEKKVSALIQVITEAIRKEYNYELLKQVSVAIDEIESDLKAFNVKIPPLLTTLKAYVDALANKNVTQLDIAISDMTSYDELPPKLKAVLATGKQLLLREARKRIKRRKG